MERIVDLYQQGLSARQVADRLGIGIHPVYSALRKAGVARRSTWETNRFLYIKKRPSFSIPAHFTAEQEKLKTIAAALYWGEGSKESRGVDLTNSDPEVLKIFLRFLREVLHIDDGKLRVYVYCFKDQSVEEICLFWSKCLNIPLTQFQKPYVRAVRDDISRRMRFGVAHVRYSDKRLFAYILQEIEAIRSMGR